MSVYSCTSRSNIYNSSNLDFLGQPTTDRTKRAKKLKTYQATPRRNDNGIISVPDGEGHHHPESVKLEVNGNVKDNPPSNLDLS